MDDMKQTVGCMVIVFLALVALAACVLIGHFFGLAIGLASLLVIAAFFVLWLACSFYATYEDT